MVYSTIQVSKATKSRLKALKLTPSESYENIIVRLLDVRLDGRELFYRIDSKDKRFSLRCSVDWGSDDCNILFYDNFGGVFTEPPMLDVDGWGVFLEEVNGLDNLVNILAILDEGDSIRANGLLLTRV